MNCWFGSILFLIAFNSCSNIAKRQGDNNLQSFFESFPEVDVINLRPKHTNEQFLTIRMFRGNSPGLLQDEIVMKKALDENFEIMSSAIASTKGESNGGNKAQINIFFEVPSPDLTSTADENWLLANQEFIRANLLPGINRVLCRHSLCSKLMEALARERQLHYTISQIKFSSQISGNVQPNVEDRRFVHFAGKSQYKNTRSVLEAWTKDPSLPQLIVTCFDSCWNRAFGNEAEFKRLSNTPNVKIFTKRLSAEELNEFRRIAFAIAPSEVEGYGHYINESKGSGQIVITLDGSPMNELVSSDFGFIIPAKITGETGDAKCPTVGFDGKDLRSAAKKALALNSHEIETMGEKAKQSFFEDYKEFSGQITKLINDAGIKQLHWNQ